MLKGNEEPRLAAKHGHARPRCSLVVERDDAIADPRGLCLLVGEAREFHLAVSVRGERAELLVGIRALRVRERPDDRVGGCEDPRSRAEVRVQRQLLRGSPVRAREALGEPQQVEEARASPGVDVLVGISDRGDREPAPEHAVE